MPTVNTAAKTRKLQELLQEVERIQEAWRGEHMPEDVGEDFDTKTKEAEALQIELDEAGRDGRIGHLKAYASGLAPGSVPVPNGNGDEPMGPDIVGYLTPGSAFLESEAFINYLKAGRPLSGSQKFQLKGSWFDRSAFVPLSRKQYHERQKAIESKALPTLSESDATTFSVIEPQRLTEFIRAAEFERLVIRDLVTVSSTGSTSVEFPRVTSAKPTAATSVSNALTGVNTKPESTVAVNVASAPVRTLAVHMPVTEQQLEDFPQIRTIVDEFLRFDILRLEEYQMMWADGTGTDLLGIMQTPGVAETTRDPDIGSGSTVTILDRVRAAVTDVQVESYEPNGLVIHPLDWEGIVLAKGSDDHYLRQAFPTEDGTLRLFSLRVVPTLAAQNYRAGVATPQRVALVGDFRGGAILWDRHMTSVEVGFINEQFIQNQRTIRAEERIAFAAWRPLAFKFVETQAASAS